MKKAFLPAPTSTSSAAGTATEDSSRSLPSSPSRNASVFFYGDVAKSESISSSRLSTDGRNNQKPPPLTDPSLHHLDLIREYSRGSSECSGSTNLNRIQSEIQRDYEQLQRSISQEFHR